MAIADYLRRGQENATPLRHLAMLAKKDPRAVRHMIARERREGTPILSDNRSGYYLPANEQEKADCIRSLRHRALEILAAADGIAQNTERIGETNGKEKE